MASARERLLCPPAGPGAGERLAIVTDTTRLTRDGLQHRAAQWADHLAELGVEPGDPVAAMGPAEVPVVAAMLGALRRGAIWVPINARYREAEIEHILRDSSPRVMLCDPSQLDRIPAVPGVAVHPLRLPSEDPSSPDQSSTQSSTDPVGRDDETAALLIYTSGTTGRSKGVELSYRAVVEGIEALTGLWRWTPTDVLSLQLPLFHVHGLCIGVIGSLLRGVTMVLHPRFGAETVVEDVRRHGATIFMGVPTMYTRLLAHLDAHPEDGAVLARARLFTAGSAALPAEDLRRFEAHTGHRILERYGMSETLITLSNPYEGERRPGSVGRPVPGVHIRVVDDDGEPVPDGEPGELQVQGPGMMTGYRGQPEATAAAFDRSAGPRPWFRTGDVVVREPDGYVRIVGRRSVDIIKSGGFKIGAREIEDVIATRPGIAEVAVLGVPDPQWGERIVAAVVLTDDAPQREPATLLPALQAHVAAQLADYKKPRQVLVLPALPRNAMGKVQKPALRPLASQGGAPGRVD